MSRRDGESRNVRDQAARELGNEPRPDKTTSESLAAWRLGHACPICNGCVNLETMTCDKCGVGLDPSAAKPAGPNFPEGATLEQTDAETWVLRAPGPTEEELRGKVTHKYPFIEVSDGR